MFLYSAISRPGDSGVAVVSDEGFLFGMTAVMSDDTRANCESYGVVFPHYVRIPSNVLTTAIDDLEW